MTRLNPSELNRRELLALAGLTLAPSMVMGQASAEPPVAPTGFKHVYENSGGIRLHAYVGGRGEPVLLLHGWPVTAYAWRHVMPLLATRFTVIAPDMPGFGDSEVSTVGYSKFAVAETMRAFVRRLGHQQISIAGHDMGGPVAFAYAASHPGEVRRLALIETALPGFGFDANAPGAWHVGFATVPDLPEALVAGRERAFLSYFYRRGTTRPDAITDRDVDEYARAYALPGKMAAGFGYYRTLAADAEAFRAAMAARKLSLPVLVVGADKGAVTRPAMFERVVDSPRGAMLAGAGHHVPDDQPTELAALLVEFFRAS